MNTYASIHIGSYGISLKVFEIVKGKRIRQIDALRRRMNLARDILTYGKLSKENLLLAVDTLGEMKETIETYRADDYDVYAGNALLSAENVQTLIDQVEISCGLHIEILDNSRQRFLLYKALCSVKDFGEIVKSRTVLVDVGGSGLQLSLFSKGRLVTTQHASFGAANVWEDLKKLRQSADYREQLLSMLYTEIEEFYDTFLEKRPPQKLIIINNPLVSVSQARAKKQDGHLTAGEYLKVIKKSLKDNVYNVSEEEISEDVSDTRLSFLLLYQAVVERIPVEDVYVPPVSLHEGMVYEYAYTNKLLTLPRDFDGDVFSEAQTIAERFHSNGKHIETLRSFAEQLYDAIKKRHGLSERSRLLLSVAAILHDCGKYISLADDARCTYTIITASEILGLSDKEREMIAWICYFYKGGIAPYQELSDKFTREEYFTLLKLHAILNVAGALDRSHGRKNKDIHFRFNGRDELSIVIDTQDSLALEKGMFEERASVFEDIFAIRPILKTVRIRRKPQ